MSLSVAGMQLATALHFLATYLHVNKIDSSMYNMLWYTLQWHACSHRI